jgi:threonine dehydratase
MSGQLYQHLPAQIAAAQARIGPYVRRTYVEHSIAYSELTGANVYFKCENLQHTGSFKLRGAMNMLLSLADKQRTQGVVAASTGNHGKAVALTANWLNSTANVFVPANSESTKISGIKKLGADVRTVGADCIESELAAREFARKSYMACVSPYNDPAVIAGQGTIGLELCEQLDTIDAVYASMGGGGLITGIGAFIKSKHSDCQMIGCSPENSQVMIQSLRAGKLLDAPSIETLSDGTAGGVEPGSITFGLCQKLVDQCVTVTEDEICQNLRRFIDTHGMLIEGAAAVAIAGLLKTCQAFPGKNVVVVLCGANIGVEKLAGVFGRT